MTEPEVLEKLKQFKNAIISKNNEITQLKNENEELKSKFNAIKDRACTDSIENAIEEISDILSNSTSLL